jgi:hypothetical protein
MYKTFNVNYTFTHQVEAVLYLYCDKVMIQMLSLSNTAKWIFQAVLLTSKMARI